MNYFKAQTPVHQLFVVDYPGRPHSCRGKMGHLALPGKAKWIIVIFSHTAKKSGAFNEVSK